jgi:phosphopantothenoylcysteine decarboxylase/phosphopantothenate--cysteine ligase
MKAIPVEPVFDVLASASRKAPEEIVKIAFAVEYGEGALESAKRKLEEKGAHLLVLNDPSEPGAGFEVDTNRVTMLDASGGVERLPQLLKTEVADKVLDRAESLIKA